MQLAPPLTIPALSRQGSLVGLTDTFFGQDDYLIDILTKGIIYVLNYKNTMLSRDSRTYIPNKQRY